MRYIVAVIVILAGFLLAGWVMRLPAEQTLPTGGVPEPPTVKQIQARAEAFEYRRGRYGGEIRYSLGEPIKTFNYPLSKDNSSTQVLSWLYDGLYGRNNLTYEIEPRIADGMPVQVNEDGTVYDVKLRKDVTWFDGKPVTADDVIFTIERIIYNPDVQTSWSYSWFLDDVDEKGRPIKVRVKVEKIDDFTVRFTLPYRWAYFLDTLSFSPLPRHAMSKAVEEGTINRLWSLDINPADVIGNGAFKLHSYKTGERITLVRNKRYYRKNQFGDRMPYIDRIKYQIVKDNGIQRDMFLAGQLDFITLTGDDMKEMWRLQEARDFTIYRRGPGTGTRFLVFNQNTRKDPRGEYYVPLYKQAWFRDLRFRKAVAHAMDRDTIRQAVFKGFAYNQYGPVSQANTRYYAGNFKGSYFDKYPIVEYTYGLEKANKLLDDMGLTRRDAEGYRMDDEGHRVEFSLYTYADSAEYATIGTIIKSDLKKVGVKVNFKAMLFNDLVGQLMNEWSWDTIIIGLTGGYLDPMNGGRNVWPTEGNLHMWNPKLRPDMADEHFYPWEREINKIFAEALKTPSYDRRKELVARFQHIISREIPLIFTVQSEVLTAASNRFGNFRPTIYTLYDPLMVFDKEAPPREDDPGKPTPRR
ncbi:MAG: ABC transporter substrate-binding protein [Planctomycetota bacterium]